MELTALPTGARAHVRAVSAESAAVLRLREMGLRPGTVLRLTARGASGSRIVSIGAARLAIDATTCSLIEVDPT
ncbi:MAG: ferrous iron transport protein A [Demequina sp.]|uniref:FeoA family protein n=1 Tax=Demequina sp. TaxID=2050685 RepID=UPI0019A25347|nr:FeoA family protein [Demequina sp.]MBC7298295.1 ferrous iron transport protein A [Demequina sp.]